MSRRRNPYPYYTDCEDAFEDLHKVFLPDLEFQRSLILENLEIWLSNKPQYLLDFDVGRFKKLVKAETTISDLELLLLDRRIPIQIKPIFFLIDNFRVVENVPFIHFSSKQRLESIEEEGFYGRATASKMTLTRYVEDFYIKENGYIFAYRNRDLQSVEISEEFVVYGRVSIEGIAKKAIEFYFEPDDEVQMIVPLKCADIHSISLDKYYNDIHDFRIEDDEWNHTAAFSPLDRVIPKREK